MSQYSSCCRRDTHNKNYASPGYSCSIAAELIPVSWWPQAARCSRFKLHTYSSNTSSHSFRPKSMLARLKSCEHRRLIDWWAVRLVTSYVPGESTIPTNTLTLCVENVPRRQLKAEDGNERNVNKQQCRFINHAHLLILVITRNP